MTWFLCSALNNYLSQNHLYMEVRLTKQMTGFEGHWTLLIHQINGFHGDKSLLIKFWKYVWLFANSPSSRLLSSSWCTRLTAFQKPQLLESSGVVNSLTEGIQKVQFSSQMNLKLKVKIKQNVTDKKINFQCSSLMTIPYLLIFCLPTLLIQDIGLCFLSLNYSPKEKENMIFHSAVLRFCIEIGFLNASPQIRNII